MTKMSLEERIYSYIKKSPYATWSQSIVVWIKTTDNMDSMLGQKVRFHTTEEINDAIESLVASKRIRNCETAIARTYEIMTN